MRGSLDNPPIVIGRNRRTPLALLFAGAGFVVAAYYVFRDGSHFGLAPDTELDLALGFFGLTAAAAAWIILLPGRLVIDRDGVTCRRTWRRVHHPWGDLSTFVIFKVRRAKIAACRYHDSCPQHRRRRKPFRTLVTFGNNWEISQNDLASLLNAANARWHGHPTLGLRSSLFAAPTRTED